MRRLAQVVALALLAQGGNAFAQEQLRVVTVPWLGDPGLPHPVHDGGAVILQGIALVPQGRSLVSVVWDPGDGADPIELCPGAFCGDGVHPRALEAEHVYSGPPGRPYVATLTVTDDLDNTDEDTFAVRVEEKTLDVESDMAVDRGLWHLHKRMVFGDELCQPRISTEESTGCWTSQNIAAATAAVVQAFEVNGHLESGDPLEDPYVEDVARGLAYLMTELAAIPLDRQFPNGPDCEGIASPPEGNDPDSNGNGIGLEATRGDLPVYVGGMITGAIVASGTPAEIAVTGGADVLGRSYRDIVQDLLDAYAWGQDDDGFGRGGWRYVWQRGADNSATQWAATAGLAAERGFELSVPDFVKRETLCWVETTGLFFAAQDDVRYGYEHPTVLFDEGLSTTPAALVQFAFAGVTTDDLRWRRAASWIVRNWPELIRYTNSQTGTSPAPLMYAYLAIAKALRLALPEPVRFLPGGVDWLRAEGDGDCAFPVAGAVPGLARSLVCRQLATGGWEGERWVSGDIATAWAVTILAPGLVQLGPVARCSAEPETALVGEPITFDATRSFHRLSNRRITRYTWDFGDGTICDGRDCEGSLIAHAFATAGSYDVVLTVADDSDPPSRDSVICRVRILPDVRALNADPGGPYIFFLDESPPLLADATLSRIPAGRTVSFEWEFAPQPLGFAFDDASGPVVDLTDFVKGRGPGTYDIGLRVTDDLGDVDVDFTQVTVFEAEPPNVPPFAHFTGATTCLEALLDASSSRDPDGRIVTYTWEFGDGSVDTTSGRVVRHEYAEEGQYTVTLTVTDNQGDPSATVMTVTVSRCRTHQRPGDCNQDGCLSLTDSICLLHFLFVARVAGPSELPCGTGTGNDDANVALLDSNGDNTIDVSDPIYVLAFLFRSGLPPALGTECVFIAGCPEPKNLLDDCACAAKE